MYQEDSYIQDEYEEEEPASTPGLGIGLFPKINFMEWITNRCLIIISINVLPDNRVVTAALWVAEYCYINTSILV